MKSGVILLSEVLATAFAGLAAADAMGRHARISSFCGPLPEMPCRVGRLLALVPAREEGEAAVAAARALLCERAAGSGPALDVLLVLDGDDPAARRALEGTGAEVLVKPVPGPHKGAALAFAAEALADRLAAYDFVLILDVDTRLPEGFLAELRIPSGTEAFQLPVRPEEPRSGAERVAAVSTAVAREDDLARDARGLPVRLRGKAMGFSPAAFLAGPARADLTTVEDSEATLRLLAAGVPIRALAGPMAHEEGTGDLSRSRARWLSGHARLLAVGAGDLLRLSRLRPFGAFVLACDLWLRPRALVLAALAAIGVGSTLALALAGRAEPGALVLAPFALSWSALLLEGRSIAIVRRRHAGALPRLTPSDLLAALGMWLRAVARGVGAPGRWHRARPGSSVR